MESLNISKVNLSSVRNQVPLENETRSVSEAEAKLDAITINDPDDEYHCEYREDIWKHLLEQEAQKPVIHLQSPQLEFRGALIQQLRDISKKLDLTTATVHSAAALLDLFMDAHRLRADRLTHVALVCLSLAAKSEEKFSRAPTLKTLSKLSNVQLCGDTFRQLEWMVGQHARWRLLAPTAAAFAALLAPLVVAADLCVADPCPARPARPARPALLRRLRRDGAKLLDAYLDLTLSDVRLKVVESVEVGCACVACARADLGLPAWPAWLARAAQRPAARIAPVARLLHRMMHILKSKEAPVESEVDQGYSSAKNSPNQTPSTSPLQVSPASSTCSTSTRSYINVDTSYRHQPVQTNMYSVLDLNTQNVNNIQSYYLPEAVDMTLRVDNSNEYRYLKSRRLIEASVEGQPAAAKAVKRGIDGSVELDRKRYRMTQVVQ